MYSIKEGEDALTRAHQLKLPMLILHGGGDKVVPPVSSQLLYDKVASEDKTLTFYPELYHEIFNEFEKDEIIATVVNWLDESL